MKYYLATTAISEIWDLDSNLLLLGPWCLTGEVGRKNKRLLEGKEYIFVPSPWKPACKIKEASDYYYKVYEELLPKLCETLNFVHQVSYPLRYWQVLLGPWLLNFIGAFYDRYKRIEKTMELFPDFYTHILPKEQCQAATFNTVDFFDKVEEAEEDYRNLKLFSLLLSDLCPGNIAVKEYKYESRANNHTYNNYASNRYIPKFKTSWKRKLFNKLITVPDLFLKCPIALSEIYELSPYDMVLLKLKNGVKTTRFIYFEAIKESLLTENYSHKLRNAINLKGAGDKFQSLLYRILPVAIPMSYMENYKSYQSSISNIKNINSVRIVGSAVGWYYNERFKFFAAEAVSKGASLIDFQHGGAVGALLCVSQELLCLEKDIFYSWGWDSGKENRTGILPNAHLSRLKNSYSQKLDSALFVGTGHPRYRSRLTIALLPEDMSKYFEDKKLFLQSLPEEAKNKLLYRPYLYDFGWKEEDIVKKVCPNVKFALKDRLESWMQKVKLVVIDHPHTSYIQALTINVPCILFWDHQVYLMRPEAEGYFKLLRDAGILFKDPVSAAKKVKEVFNDPLSWWLQDDVQRARVEFCKHYAYARKDWLEVWTEELRQLPKGDRAFCRC